MSLLRARDRVYLRLLLVAILVSACGASIEGQEPSKLQTSRPRAIILPQQLLAGDPATLAVLDAAGRVMSGVVVELSTGQKVTTDAAGRALFVAPSEPGTMTAKIPGQEITTVSAVEDASSSAEPSPVEGSRNQYHSLLSYPRFLTLHDRFTIQGTGFNGRADSNHVLLGDQPCLVLASSPLSLIVLPGLRIPIGPASLLIRSNGQELGPVPVAIVLLEFSGPTEALNAGSQSKLVLHAHGTTESVAVEVRNSSPDIVQFPHGNVQRLRTSGGEENIASVDMKLLAAGNYTVSAKLVPTQSASPELEAVRQKLIDARRIAFGPWIARVDHVIARIDQSPQDAAQIRADLKQIIDDKPSGQLATLLDSARQELNQR